MPSVNYNKVSRQYRALYDKHLYSMMSCRINLFHKATGLSAFLGQNSIRLNSLDQRIHRGVIIKYQSIRRESFFSRYLDRLIAFQDTKPSLMPAPIWFKFFIVCTPVRARSLSVPAFCMTFTASSKLSHHTVFS